jgi:hypothetical protein
MEDGPGSKGKRLYLTMTGQEKNAEQITALQRRKTERTIDEDRFLVFFDLVRERPLVGDDPKT